jgi:intracellular sulfur oxidation DsrE/DsrF family protein
LALQLDAGLQYDVRTVRLPGRFMLLRNLLIFFIAALVSWYLINTLLSRQVPVAPSVTGERPLEPIAPQSPGQAHGLLADINVHTLAELQVLFDRVESLLDRPRSEADRPLISLVLHGPEVRFFAIDQYSQYKSIVDQAARLAALGGVDISICQTQMRNYGLGEEDVPAFLNQVPYGPDEVRRQVEEGYVYM